MKKIMVVLFSWAVISGGYGQQVQWKSVFGGKHAEYLFDGLYTLDYGFMMVGGTFSESGDVPVHLGGFDAFVIKVDEDGKKEWTQVWGGKGNDVFRCIANTQDGGYLLAASSSSGKENNKRVPQIGGNDIWLIKIDITGREEWQKVLGGKADDIPVKVIRTHDGGFLVAAETYSGRVRASDTLHGKPDVILKESESFGNKDYWIVKLDNNGNKVWEKTLGGRYADHMAGVVETADGTLIVGGYSNSPAGEGKSVNGKGANDWWVLALSDEGDILWQRNRGGKYNDELYAVSMAPDGGILLGGFMTRSADNGKRNTDMVLIKINARGEKLWQKKYDQSRRDVLRDMWVNKDGSVVLGGYATATALPPALRKTPVPVKKGNEDYLLIKVDKQGKELWRKFYGGPGKQLLNRLIEVRDGGYVMMGTTENPAQGKDPQFLIIKINDRQKPVREPLPLEAVPNPAGDYTRIVIGEKYDKGHLIVSDLHGRVLQSFDIEKNRIIPLSLAGYRPAIYIVRVSIGDKANSVKIIKQK